MVRTVLATVVMVVMVFAVMVVAMMARRVVGTVLGDGGPGAAYGYGQRDGEGRGRACDQLHVCLLNGRATTVARKLRPRDQGIRIPARRGS
jgi:hypothetical protein